MEPTRQEPPPPTPRRRSEHLELLLAMIALLVIQSFTTPTSIAQRALLNLLFLALIVSGIRTLSSSRNRMIATMLIGLTAFVISCIAEARPSALVDVIVYGCYIAVFVQLLIALCESVFVDGPVDSNRIFGAISIYFVLGLIWAFAYTLLETLRPGSFAITAMSSDVGVRHGLISEFMYFSNVTLTTLGYGDIVPVSRPAQMMATLQAIFGQLYLTVVVARLVGLHITRKQLGSEKSEPDTDE